MELGLNVIKLFYGRNLQLFVLRQSFFLASLSLMSVSKAGAYNRVGTWTYPTKIRIAWKALPKDKDSCLI
jgi:hypothetical protein